MSRAFRIPTERELDLIGVGEGMVELWADEPLGQAAVLHRSHGGDVLNTLVMAARLGSRVGLISKVGSDPFGVSLLRQWQEEGVDTRNCPLVPGVNGVYFISLLRDGEREFSYCRQGSAASTLAPEDVDETYLTSARAVMLSGITQAISEGAKAATLKAAETVREHGGIVAFDPNYRSSLWADRAVIQGLNAAEGVTLARQALAELMPFIDILLPSFPSDSALWQDEPQTAEAFAVACMRTAVPLTGIKLGDGGVKLLHEAQQIHVKAVPIDPIVDTTGAGDAWNAAFLHGLLAGQDPSEAAAYGNHVAAWKLKYRGAIPPKSSGLAVQEVQVTRK